MTCVGDNARVLLKATAKRFEKCRTRREAIALFTAFAEECRKLISKAECEWGDLKNERDQAADDARDARQELRREKSDELLCDRLISGNLKLDDYVFARKRRWPIERLEQLAGVRS